MSHVRHILAKVAVEVPSRSEHLIKLRTVLCNTSKRIFSRDCQRSIVWLYAAIFSTVLFPLSTGTNDASSAFDSTSYRLRTETFPIRRALLKRGDSRPHGRAGG